MLGIDSRIARYAWTVVALFILIALLYRIRDTIFTFLIALFFAYLLWPVLQYLDKHIPGRSRTQALAIVYVLLVALLVFAGFEIGSRVIAEATKLANKLPDIVSSVNASKAAKVPPGPHSMRQEMILEVKKQLAEHSKEIAASVPKLAVKALLIARILLAAVLIPILSFFFLKDGYALRESIFSIVPEGVVRRQVEDIGADVHVLLSQYMRALTLLAAIAFAAYGVFFSIIRVPYAILLAAIDFPLEFIPIVGPFAAFAIIMLVSVFSGYGHIWWILAYMALFRLVQDYVISPHLMSSEFKLHPLLVIFGVLAGAQIAGVIGAFVSVPVLAFARIVYLRLRRRRLVVVKETPPITQSG